jgi:F0F1-type ATP synthase epsilon subunit
MILLPSLEGEIGVLYNHIPIITGLQFGLINLLDQQNNVKMSFYIDEGIAQINREVVHVVCNQCTSAKELNIDTLEEKISLLTGFPNKISKLNFYQKILDLMNKS